MREGERERERERERELSHALPGMAKVGNLCLAVGAERDVSQGNVSVHHPLRVQVMQPGSNLLAQVELFHRVKLKPLLTKVLQALAQVAVLCKLEHRQPRALGEADANKLVNVWVVQRRESGRLPHKHGVVLRVCITHNL